MKWLQFGLLLDEAASSEAFVDRLASNLADSWGWVSAADRALARDQALQLIGVLETTVEELAS